MKLLFWCSIFLLISFSLSYSKSYKLHSLVEQTINDEKKRAIDLWINFLFEDDINKRKELWNENEIENYGDDYALFEKAFFQYGRSETLQFLSPYILSIEQRDNLFFISTMFSYFPLSISDTAIQNHNPASIIKVGVIKINENLLLTNVLDYETYYWNKYPVNHIKYYVHPALKPIYEDMNNASKFIDSLNILWNGSPYKDTIIYYVAPTSELINSIVGFSFAYLGSIGSGQAFNDAKLVFSGNSNFNYRHEIAHLVFGKFDNHMLSEGLATYFGGSGDQFYENLKDKFLTQFKMINYETIENYLSYPNSFEYYMLGALLVEQVFRKNGIDGLKNLISTNEGNDPVNSANLFIERVLSELSISKTELFKIIYD